ncbi:MAG: conjugative transfer ATPase [Gammaproteobacteria bacterium]|jgi:conjugative transfer ATPase|nr:conjugative transfer ATPase [Gammaproteobacteria bacterium]
MKTSHASASRRPTVSLSHIKKQYVRNPSFADLLPIAEWDDETQTALLEDGKSLGALLELRDVATEARPEPQIKQLHDKVMRVLSRVVPLESENPWVIQFFVQDDATLLPLYEKLCDAASPQQEDKFTQAYLDIQQRHLTAVAREGGFFHDPTAGHAFRGKTRRIRLAVYRRYGQSKKEKASAYNRDETLKALNQVVADLMSHLQTIGLKVRRLNGKHLYAWLVRWFNPNPQLTDGNVDELLNRFPYPEATRQPSGWSITSGMLLNQPETSPEGWRFDGLEHRLMLFEGLKQPVDVGVISRERRFGDQYYALFDKFPDGSIYTLQIVFESQKAIDAHLNIIRNTAKGKSESAVAVRQAVEVAQHEIANGNQLFKVVQGLYYCAKDKTALAHIEREITALLSHSGLTAVPSRFEPNPIDTYLRLLPFNFNPHFDKQYLYKSTYQYASEVSALLPIYGRSRGDGKNPLHIYFNRGGEPFIFDHLHSDFKMANSHMAIVGSTGAGKSVTLNNLIMGLLAIKNARVFVIEAGGSFDLLANFVESHGKSVKRLKFNRQKPIAINPFAQAYQALTEIEQEEALFADLDKKQSQTTDHERQVIEEHVAHYTKELQEANKLASKEEQGCEENRDLLSEMALAIRTMVTGGLPQEEARFTLADDMLVVENLIGAIKACKAANKLDVLTHDVIDYFQKSSQQQNNANVAERLDEMARAMQIYVKNPVKARFFNRPSKPLGDCDLMTIDMGFLQEKQNAPMLALVMISLLPKILAVAEANQYSKRPTILLLDESHILFSIPLVAAFIVLMSKVARKIGLWITAATQNIEDFPTEEAKKALSMMETWLCLNLSKKEIEKVNQFKALTEEQIALLQNVTKIPKLYTEGVLLGARYQGLFRNIPPRLSLALAMTEQDEKAERKRLMDEHSVSELQAAEMIAKKLESYQYWHKEDDDFDV